MGRDNILSSFKALEEFLPKSADLSKSEARAFALKHYFSKGGIISVAKSNGEWPILLYPNKLRLKHQIQKRSELKNRYLEKRSAWLQKQREAQVYNVVNNVKKLKEPLYWQHMVKYMSDKDYRSDADSVKLPVHLVADRRWKPMVKMFVTDLDYRKQLSETVQNSIVYKTDKRVARYANVLQAFRLDQSNRKLDELQKKIEGLNADIKALQEIMKWAST